MEFKVGDIVRISQGVGRVIYIGDRKMKDPDNPSGPCIPNGKKFLTVQVKTPRTSPLMYYNHYAWPEYARIVSKGELVVYEKNLK
tara:strand:- start:8660 stop:8914 length:255 start_codon:yes stop_codon:yes gene_type:complete